MDRSAERIDRHRPTEEGLAPREVPLQKPVDDAHVVERPVVIGVEIDQAFVGRRGPIEIALDRGVVGGHGQIALALRQPVTVCEGPRQRIPLAGGLLEAGLKDHAQFPVGHGEGGIERHRLLEQGDRTVVVARIGELDRLRVAPESLEIRRGDARERRGRAERRQRLADPLPDPARGRVDGRHDPGRVARRLAVRREWGPVLGGHELGGHHVPPAGFRDLALEHGRNPLAERQLQGQTTVERSIGIPLHAGERLAHERRLREFHDAGLRQIDLERLGGHAGQVLVGRLEVRDQEGRPIAQHALGDERRGGADSERARGQPSTERETEHREGADAPQARGGAGEPSGDADGASRGGADEGPSDSAGAAGAAFTPSWMKAVARTTGSPTTSRMSASGCTHSGSVMLSESVSTTWSATHEPAR